MADDFITQIKKHLGGTMAEGVTDEQICGRLINLDPDSRANFLVEFDKGADEAGSNLRQHARFLQMRRTLRGIDYSLRKAGK